MQIPFYNNKGLHIQMMKMKEYIQKVLKIDYKMLHKVNRTFVNKELFVGPI